MSLSQESKTIFAHHCEQNGSNAKAYFDLNFPTEEEHWEGAALATIIDWDKRGRALIQSGDNTEGIILMLATSRMMGLMEERLNEENINEENINEETADETD